MERPPLIAVEKLTWRPFAGAPAVLRGVNFELSAGERVVLSGASGSGKSTLLRCMVLLEPAEGRVLLDGEPVEPAGARGLRRRVGYMPQRAVGVGGTVGENLAFPRELGGQALGEEKQRTLLAAMGLQAIEPGRRFDALSGGERQRLALVRSITAQPDVLLLDEPTASLDPENVDSVVELLMSWLDADGSRALVWVSHHAHQVRGLATRAVSMTELGS